MSAHSVTLDKLAEAAYDAFRTRDSKRSRARYERLPESSKETWRFVAQSVMNTYTGNEGRKKP